MRKVIYIIPFILLIALNYLSAQNQFKSTAGTYFVLCFPTNSSFEFKENKSLWLYASSHSGDTVKGIISTKFSESFEIQFSVAGDSVANIRIPDDLEVSSYCETENKGIYVKTDKPINLYGLSTKKMSSDAFLCFPVEALDTIYTIASSKNVFHSSGQYPGFKPNNFFSNITIVGVEDSTIVNIVPACPVYYPKVTKHENFSIMLNKGETRQIIADITDENDTSGTNEYDLTASIITSSKSIVVFSGHIRTEITNNTPGASDVLIEETPPVSFLGSQTVITPVFSSASGNNSYTRIIPFFDSTRVIIGDSITLLNRLSFIDFHYSSSSIIKSNKPILTAIYGRSAMYPSESLIGDPFLIFPSPIEQFLNEYTFTAVPMSNFSEHYLNIIIHENGLESLILDDLPLPDSIFHEVTATSYVWARVLITPGSHHIKSDSSFGIIVYGNGHLDSYGYCGGQRTERLLESIVDNNPPLILKNIGCETLINIMEENSFDSGIESIEIISSKNVNVNIPSYSPGAFSAKVIPKLINQYEDGDLIFLVKDMKGLITYDTLNIKGLTISLTSNPVEKEVHIGRVISDTVYLNNYGKQTQELNAYCKQNIYISVPQYGFPVNITADSTAAIPIVFGNYYLEKAVDTVVIIDECGRVLEKEIIFQSLPNVYIGSTYCDVRLIAKSKKALKVAYFDNTIFVENFSGKIEIYNILGSLVFNEEISGSSEIPINDFPSGVYFIRVKDEILKFCKLQ